MLVSVFTSDLAVVSSAHCVRLIVWIWLLKLLSAQALGTEGSQSLRPGVHILVGGSSQSPGIYCVCVQLLVDVYRTSLMSKPIAACSNKPLTFFDTVSKKNLHLLLIQKAFTSLSYLWSRILFYSLWLLRKYLKTSIQQLITVTDHCNLESTFSVECHLNVFLSHDCISVCFPKKLLIENSLGTWKSGFCKDYQYLSQSVGGLCI